MPADRPAPKKEPKSLRPADDLNDLISWQQHSLKLTADVARLLREVEKHIAKLDHHIAKGRRTRPVPVLNFPSQ